MFESRRTLLVSQCGPRSGSQGDRRAARHCRSGSSRPANPTHRRVARRSTAQRPSQLSPATFVYSREEHQSGGHKMRKLIPLSALALGTVLFVTPTQLRSESRPSDSLETSFVANGQISIVLSAGGYEIRGKLGQPDPPSLERAQRERASKSRCICRRKWLRGQDRDRRTEQQLSGNHRSAGSLEPLGHHFQLASSPLRTSSATRTYGSTPASSGSTLDGRRTTAPLRGLSGPARLTPAPFASKRAASSARSNGRATESTRCVRASKRANSSCTEVGSPPAPTRRRPPG